MTENNEPTESIETPEITDEAIAGFIDHGGEAPSFHPVLEVWREVLKPARTEADAKVTPQWASRIVQSYPGIEFADMENFRNAYFGKILQLLEILEVEIDGDDECLRYTSAEEDAEHNAHHYKNLLLTWQLQFLQWELDWETTAAWAATELAAISEVHKMFFGEQGIVPYLDQIKFEFTEADQAMLGAALEELKAGADE